MKKLTLIFTASFLLMLSLTTQSFAFDIKAGPIWNDDNAKEVCPKICKNYAGWSGHWVTTVRGKMSVCGCNQAPVSENPYDANAGPIWNDADAPGKCPSACKFYGGWNSAKSWLTKIRGKMSVCGCVEKVKP